MTRNFRPFAFCMIGFVGGLLANQLLLTTGPFVSLGHLGFWANSQTKHYYALSSDNVVQWEHSKHGQYSHLTMDEVQLAIMVVGSDLGLWNNATTCIKSILMHRTGPLRIHILLSGSRRLKTRVRRDLSSKGPLSRVAGLRTGVVDLDEPRLKGVLDDPKRMAFWLTHFSLNHTLPADTTGNQDTNSGGDSGRRRTAVANKIVKTVLELVLPASVPKVIFLDTDTLILADVRQLWDQFKVWNRSQSVGLAPEMVRVYTDHMAPWAVVPKEVLGADGFNTGVMMLDLDKLRAVNFQNSSQAAVVFERERQRLPLLDISDQDLYNLFLVRHPEHLFEISCSWNYQLTAIINPWHRHCLHAVPRLIHGNFAMFGGNRKLAEEHGYAIYKAYGRTAWHLFMAPPAAMAAPVLAAGDDHKAVFFDSHEKERAITPNSVVCQTAPDQPNAGTTAADCISQVLSHYFVTPHSRSHTEALADSTTEYSIRQGDKEWYYGYYDQKQAVATPFSDLHTKVSDDRPVVPPLRPPVTTTITTATIDLFHQWPTWKLAFYHHGTYDYSKVFWWDRYELLHASTENEYFGGKCHPTIEVDACSHTVNALSVAQVNQERDVGARDDYWNVTLLVETNRFGGLPSRRGYQAVRRWIAPQSVTPSQPLLITGKHHAERAPVYQDQEELPCTSRFKASIFHLSPVSTKTATPSAATSSTEVKSTAVGNGSAAVDQDTVVKVHRSLIYERVLTDRQTETNVRPPAAVYHVVLYNGVKPGDALDFVLSYADPDNDDCPILHSPLFFTASIYYY